MTLLSLSHSVSRPNGSHTQRASTSKPKTATPAPPATFLARRHGAREHAMSVTGTDLITTRGR